MEKRAPMKISMIAAIGANRVIGKDNDMPWHLPDDFAYFKDTTINHVVIMGRKNWESLSHLLRPLSDRTNIVITRQKNYQAEGAEIVSSLEHALQIAKSLLEEEAFIIGGGEIYRIALPLASQIYLTEINSPFEGDVTFPELDKKVWKEISRTHHPIDKRHDHSFDFVIYQKTKGENDYNH